MGDWKLPPFHVNKVVTAEELPQHDSVTTKDERDWDDFWKKWMERERRLGNDTEPAKPSSGK